jgi:hypothetical protein
MYLSQKTIDSNNTAEIKNDNMLVFTRVSSPCFVTIFELLTNKINSKYKEIEWAWINICLGIMHVLRDLEALGKKNAIQYLHTV